MINTTNWKEFRVGDLFDVHQLERVTDRGGYVPDNDIIDIDGQYPYLAAVSTNNGVKGYTNIKPNNDGNCITLSTTADSSNTIFYQPEPFIGRQQMAGIYKNNISQMNENIALFIISILRKQLMSFNYSNKLTFNALCDIKLLLPAINDKPDFDYMEEYIEEIKLKYVDKLEKDNNENIDKALKITGLSYQDLNKDLTVKPADRYEEFKIGDLFNGISGDTDIKQHHINNKRLPVITSGLSNNGLLGLSDVKAKVISQNTITVDMFGNAFYRNYNYKMVTHARVFALKPKFHITDNIGLYFATMLFYLSKKFDYSNMCSYEKIKNNIIVLPAIDENTPDFDYMEKAIYIYTAKKIKLKKLSNEKEIKLLRNII